MLTTVFHSKIFITNLMTGKCHHQPSSFLSRTSPPLPQDSHQHIFHEPGHNHQLTLFHPRRSWTMWSSILRSRLTRPLVRLTSAFPIPPTRFLRRSICLSVRRGSFRDLSTFTNQFCSLTRPSIDWESRPQKIDIDPSWRMDFGSDRGPIFRCGSAGLRVLLLDSVWSNSKTRRCPAKVYLYQAWAQVCSLQIKVLSIYFAFHRFQGNRAPDMEWTLFLLSLSGHISSSSHSWCVWCTTGKVFVMLASRC